MEPNLLNIQAFLPACLLDVETQAVIIAGLCCVGAWVILQWMIQLMCSVLWPFFAIALILIFMPGWRKALAEEYLPQHVLALKTWTERLASGLNMSYSS